MRMGRTEPRSTVHAPVQRRVLHSVLRAAPPRLPPSPTAESPASARKSAPPRACSWTSVGNSVQQSCFVEESGVQVPQRAGVERLLPPLHPGSIPMAFRGTFDYSLDAKNRLT